MRKILEKLVKGELSIDEAESLIKVDTIRQLGIAAIDIDREKRTGIPETILAETKDPLIAKKIALEIVENKGFVMLTKILDEHVKVFEKEDYDDIDIEIHKEARTIILKKPSFEIEKTGGKIGVITAGSSDIPIAEESKLMAESMGCEVYTTFDVGVAGLHRLFPPLGDMIEKGIDCLIVVAGMEGTLPSVVAGLVDIPVIGVPARTGYGLGGEGIGALITMLQSCSPGLVVVNVDNGFGAGATAALIANRVAMARK